jgi:hypothetical protein
MLTDLWSPVSTPTPDAPASVSLNPQTIQTLATGPEEVLRLRDAALDALARGFAILTCEPKDKAPYAKYSPHAVNSSTRKPEVALAAWAAGEEANYGVGCGPSNITCVDVDHGVKDYGYLKLWMAQHGLPETFTVQTGREGEAGFHLYYSGAVPTCGFNIAGVTGELKGIGGYVVGAGSRHPSGKLYQIVNDIAVTPIPDSLVSLAKEKAKKDLIKTKAENHGLIPISTRWEFIRSTSGKLRNAGFSDEEGMYDALKHWTAVNCEDGANYPDEKIREIAHAAVTKFEAEPLTLVTCKAKTLTETIAETTYEDALAIFHTVEEYESAKEVTFAIKGFLQEDAVTFIGGPSGDGKTFILLAMSKALLEGKPLFNHEPFAVDAPAERVIYFIPESTLSPFKKRVKLMGLEPFFYAKKFLFKTLSSNYEVDLTDPRVLKAVKGAHVFLDTAVRFMDGEEVTDSKKFAETVFGILKAGAKSVTAAHHSAKDFNKQNYMSLENILRGSGDIGAMCATVWGVKQTDEKLNQIFIQNCKPRDFEPCEPFVIQGRPYINDTGTFHVVATDVVFNGQNHTFGSILWTQEMVEVLESYDTEKRKKLEQALSMHQQNHSNKKIGDKLDVSDQTIANWLKDFNEKVSLKLKKKKKSASPLTGTPELGEQQ